jgi:hypothetical protein
MKDVKPRCKLVGADGNVFNLLGLASHALKKANQIENAKKMVSEVMSCGSYDEALQIIMKYVKVE